MAETTSNTNHAGANIEEANSAPAEMAKESSNAAAGEAANSAGGEAPSTAEEHVPSSLDPQATDLPTQDNPDPETANPAVNPNATTKDAATAPEETAAKSTAEAPTKTRPAKEAPEVAAQKADGKKPKKEAKPAVEDKPFPDFIQQDYLPGLEKALAKKNIQVQLTFENNEVTGRWANGQRQFTVYFPKQDLKGIKVFSCATNGLKPSTLEPFLIDERAITVDLLVFGVIQRLNAQKWFGNN